MPAHELAQLNIGVIKGAMDSPVMAEFAANLDRINAVADSMPGFVWRLQTEAGDATAIHPFEDEKMLVNMSVWRDVESLSEYVYSSAHVEIMCRRREWFERMNEAFLVLWWVPRGHRPSIDEAIAKLTLLRTKGSTAEAFTFRQAFPPPDGKPVHPLMLYSGPISMFGAKAEIAALEKGLDFELIMVAYEAQSGYSPKHPEVLRINPKRQVPVLVHGELEIFDSTQIFEYLEELKPNSSLWPQGIPARARARLLEHQSDEVYFPHVIRLMGLQEHLQDSAAMAAIDGCKRYYADMERQLADGEWLAGNYSFADIAFYMAALFGERQGAPLDDATPKLLAWRERMTQRPAVSTVVSAMGRWLAQNGRAVPAFIRRTVSGDWRV